MKWLSPLLLLIGLSIAAAGVDAKPRKARGTQEFHSNSIDIKYLEPQSPDHLPVYKLVREREGLEKLREILSPLRLPRRLQLRTRGCDGISNAWYDGESVTVCYEYLDDLWKKAPDKPTPAGIVPIDTLVGPFTDVFLHEVGHAIFDILRVPLFGREEDAADQFSTYIMLQFDKEQARRLILGSAYQYKGDLTDPNVTMPRQKFADEHGTPAQRFYNLLCTAYGADPKLFADFVDKGFLPIERAAGCEDEYAQISRAFNTLIGPHIDRKLARNLHKTWLPPITTRPKRWRAD